VDEGKVRYVGISEASPADIRAAHAVCPLSAVQLEWSLWSRDVEVGRVGGGDGWEERGEQVLGAAALGMGLHCTGTV
jgi:hypothetical protein